MARFYLNLIPDNRRCRRCGRPSKLFGNVDRETGWTGWCEVCNADWRVRCFVGHCRCCRRSCSIASPVLCGMGFGIPCSVAMKIKSYLFVDSAIRHRVVMRSHKRALQLLEWTSARLDWYLCEDSSEELSLDEQPMLWSLRHVHLHAPFGPFARSCFSSLDRRRSKAFCTWSYMVLDARLARGCCASRRNTRNFVVVAGLLASPPSPLPPSFCFHCPLVLSTYMYLEIGLGKSRHIWEGATFALNIAEFTGRLPLMTEAHLDSYGVCS